MEFPRLWQFAQDMIDRRRRRVLDYATPEPRRSVRQWLDDAGGPGSMLLFVCGVALLAVKFLYFRPRSGTMLRLLGVACMVGVVAWRRRSRAEPW